SIHIIGVNTVNATAKAIGGTSGAASSGATGSTGGAGTATAEATGLVANATATGTAGLGDTGTGAGIATAIGHGKSGTVTATGNASLRAGNLITVEQATSSAVVNGTSTAIAEANIGTPPAFVSSDQAIAFVTGMPSNASVTAVLGANPNINTAFSATATPEYFA